MVVLCNEIMIEKNESTYGTNLFYISFAYNICIFSAISSSFKYLNAK